MKIPQIGLGTWKLQGEKVIEALSSALEIGYRHFDTAWIYKNEKEVGTALSSSSCSREQLWITTKVWFDFVPDHRPHHFQQSDFLYTQLNKRFDQTLKDLRTDYLDLVLLHWPTHPDNDAQAFDQLLKRKKVGKIRQVGVANFPFDQLQLLYQRFGSEIFTNQIEWHPCLSSPQIEAFAKAKNLKLTAYSPLGHGHLLENLDLQMLAKNLNCSVAQLCIAYLLAKDALVIPKASSKERLLENFGALHLMLSEETIEAIDHLPKTFRYCNPPFAPHWN